MKIDQDSIKFNEKGLVPVIVQNAETREVLMLAWANAEALARTAGEGFAFFWSRSRDELWKKGESSGNTMSVLEILLDCDGDALVYLVNPSGPACHTGKRSCFFRGNRRGRWRE